MIRRLVLMLAVIAAGAAGTALLAHRGAPPDSPAAAPPGPLPVAGPGALGGQGTAPAPLAVRLDVPADPCASRSTTRRGAGLLFDLDTGRVLWRRNPTRVLPIASLTKMMTALLVAERVPPRGRVRITQEALRYRGSGVGLLPRGKLIGVDTMLHGLLLPSGNDAAIALAQRAAAAASARFVRLMNAARAGDGAALHALLVAERDPRRGQPLVRRRPRGARARRAAQRRGWRGSSRKRSRDAARSRSRAASSTSTTRTRCCATRYRGTTGVKTGLHRRRGALPRGDGAARADAPRRRAAALPGPGAPGASGSWTAASRPTADLAAPYSVGGDDGARRPTAPAARPTTSASPPGPASSTPRGAGLDAVRLRHRALPERDLGDVEPALRAARRRLGAPLLISAMTGGTAEAAEVNRAARRARRPSTGIGLVLGSGRPLLDDPALLPTYRPAGGPRPPLLLANLGAAQVRGPGAPARAERLVELLDADGLSIHLNPVQEAVQPEGEPALRRRARRHRGDRRAARAAARRRQGGRLRDGRRGRARARRRRRRGGRRRGRGRDELGADRGPARHARRRAWPRPSRDWGVPTAAALARRACRRARAAGDRLGRAARRRRRREVPRARRVGGRAGAAVPDRGARRPRGRGGRRGDRAAAGRDLGGGRARRPRRSGEEHLR